MKTPFKQTNRKNGQCFPNKTSERKRDEKKRLHTPCMIVSFGCPNQNIIPIVVLFHSKNSNKQTHKKPSYFFIVEIATETNNVNKQQKNRIDYLFSSILVVVVTIVICVLEDSRL